MRGFILLALARVFILLGKPESDSGSKYYIILIVIKLLVNVVVKLILLKIEIF